MQPRRWIPAGAVLLCLGALVALAASSQAGAPATSADRWRWTDDFEDPTLDSRWTWVREDLSHWSLTDRPGFLRIVTQEGTIGVGDDCQNILLTAAPPVGDYQITTRVTISPTENFHAAALLIYRNDDNYIRLSRRFANGNQQINFRQEIVGSLVRNASVDETATTVFLRIAKTGGSYQGLYSTDGISYTLVREFNGLLSGPLQVGIASESGTSLVEIPSDYDFFQLEADVREAFLPLAIRH